MPVNKVFQFEDNEHIQLEVYDSGESICVQIFNHKLETNGYIYLSPYDMIELIKHIKNIIEIHINENDYKDEYKNIINKELKELFN